VKSQFSYSSYFLLSPTHATCPSHHNSIHFYHLRNTLKAVKLINLPIMQISTTSCHFPTLSSKYSNQHSILQHLHSISSLTHTRPSLHHAHCNKRVHIMCYRQKVHTISVKHSGDAPTAEDTKTEEAESTIRMKTDATAPYNGRVTKPTLHCSICMLNCKH
jgi:hypothetical protein